MQRSPHVRRSPAAAGISYIEVLVTALLLSLVVGAMLPLLTQGQESYWELRQRQQMVQNARVALDKIVREFRAAESLRAVGPGLLRFTLYWGDGSGASPTVEYVLNNATGDLQYRWGADWDYQRAITVRTQDAVPAGYAVAITFNHAALVAAGKSLASGDDVRVRSGGTELDRVLDPTSAWNRTDTTVWFRLQAAIAANRTVSNYFLYYGNLSAGLPSANADNIFLDYEDGATLDGWTRRDALSGSYAPSADGFVFQAAAADGWRKLTKNIAHTNVEVFWGFWSDAAAPADGYRAGVMARLSDSGAGYSVTPGDEGNTVLRIRYWDGWSSGGATVGEVSATIAPGTDYFGRFYLVGRSLRAKYWAARTAEPAGWMLTTASSARASGSHYGQADAFAAPQDHRHRTVILRPRVDLEPILTLGSEVAGTRADALRGLAEPFRSMSVACFDAAGGPIDCVATTAVRLVEVTLTVMDPTGRIPDITVTGRAYRPSR